MIFDPIFIGNLLMIPESIQALIDSRDHEALCAIVLVSEDKVEIAWAELGLAECWRLGGQNYKPNKKYSLGYCEEIFKKKSTLPNDLLILGLICKADCLRVGD